MTDLSLAAMERPPSSRPSQLAGSAPDPACVKGPDFICFGSQKSGTRWLYDQMNNRSDVWMPPIKELDYFIGRCLKPKNLRSIRKFRSEHSHKPGESAAKAGFMDMFERYDGKTCGIDWYKQLFGFSGGLKSGDISPNYSNLDAPSISTIAKNLPETRFMMLVREPIQRLWSALCMQVRSGRIGSGDLGHWNSLKRILRDKNLRLKSQQSFVWSRWAESIPGDRLRYWFFDDIVGRPDSVIKEISAYIDVEHRAGSLPFSYNKKQGKDKVEMLSHIKTNLAGFLRPEYEACAEIFGGHAVEWMNAARCLW